MKCTSLQRNAVSLILWDLDMTLKFSFLNFGTPAGTIGHSHRSTAEIMVLLINVSIKLPADRRTFHHYAMNMR